MNRLKELREDSDLSQEYCSIIANISKNSYIRYEKGLRATPDDVLISFSSFYRTSVDYILGLTDEIKPYPRTRKK